MSALEIKISKEFDGVCIREYLKEQLDLSSRLIRSAAREQRILVNGKAVTMRYTLFENDNLVVKLDRQESQNIKPEKMDIKVVYEDEDILVVNKPPNIVVHPTQRHPFGTLANGILYYFKETNQNCIVRLVSRLDMDTSGLIIIGKNQYAHMSLSKVMKENKLEKRYITVVHGHLENEEGTINEPIYRPEDAENGIKRIVDPRGQNSITHYKVLERLNNADIVECLLETGRTHQIRVHLSYLGHPIYGDMLYGYGEEEKDLIERQALHAYRLRFESPRSKKMLDLKSDIPEDIKELIDKLK